MNSSLKIFLQRHPWALFLASHYILLCDMGVGMLKVTFLLCQFASC